MQVKDVKEGMEATYLGEDEDNSHKQGECTAGVVKPEHSRSKKPLEWQHHRSSTKQITKPGKDKLRVVQLKSAS